MSSKVTIRGRSYNLDDVDDLASIQTVLVSENWPAKRSEGVRLFLSLQNMLSLQLKRHLAANFKSIMKSAFEEAENDGKAAISIAYNFTIDMTAPTVATIAAHKIGYSVKHGTTGKPMTHDLNQGEFLDDDMSVVFDVKGFAKENAAPPEENNIVPIGGADTEGDVTAETTPGDTPAAATKKPRKPKKS